MRGKEGWRVGGIIEVRAMPEKRACYQDKNRW